MAQINNIRTVSVPSIGKLPLADILLDRRVDADELIEIMTKKLGGNPQFWRVKAAKLAGCDYNASTITLTQQQAIQLLSKIWGSE